MNLGGRILFLISADFDLWIFLKFAIGWVEHNIVLGSLGAIATIVALIMTIRSRIKTSNYSAQGNQIVVTVVEQ
ncbi:MAG: hypothetical protein MRJ52_09570 [Nitrosomonas sp.]|nr:hypothetical protein [Nitrosomonas sp.]